MATVFSSSRPLACWGGERGVKEKEQSEEEPWRNPPRVSRAPRICWRGGSEGLALPAPQPPQPPHSPAHRGTENPICPIPTTPTHSGSPSSWPGDPRWQRETHAPLLLGRWVLLLLAGAAPRRHWGSRRPRPCVPPPYVPPSPRLSPVSHRVCLPRMAPAVTPGLCLPAASSGPTGRAAGS